MNFHGIGFGLFFAEFPGVFLLRISRAYSDKCKDSRWLLQKSIYSTSLLVNIFSVGMPSLFVNLILKTLHHFHMKVLNERILKWVHLSLYHKWFLRYLHLKFKKEVIFLGRFSPYEIPESGDKISNF